jgi:DNA polymerase III subunit epsilon
MDYVRVCPPDLSTTMQLHAPLSHPQESSPDRRTWIALDFETTGLSPHEDRIVEIGAVRFDASGRELATFNQLVNPLRRSSPRARAVHGITDEELSTAATAAVVLPDFLDFLGDPSETTLLAHNAGFDAAFLGAELARISLAMPLNGIVDTLALARRCLPNLSSHRLDGLARHLGLDPFGPHRALADSRRVMGLWLALGGESGLPMERPPAIYPIYDPAGPLPAPHGWDRLSEAVARGWTVRVIYEGGTRGDVPREITPRRFVNRGGIAYVASFCHIDAKEKDFRLDRVRSYEVLIPAVPGQDID